MRRSFRRKRSVRWTPALWPSGSLGPYGFSLGVGSVTATPLLSLSSQATVSADNMQVFNGPLRWALEGRLERLLGDISFSYVPGGAGVSYAWTVHYGIAVLRTQPESGTPFDLQDWDPSVYDNQKRWLWRRAMKFTAIQGFTLPSDSWNTAVLPWGSWHDIKPRCSIRFGEEDLFLLTAAYEQGEGTDPGTMYCAAHVRALLSHGR